MDYGQHNQSQPDPFASGLTAGVGDAPAETNPLQPEENLDLTDFMPGHDPSHIGNAALGAPGEASSLSPREAIWSNTNSPSGKLGEIVNLPTPAPREPALGAPSQTPASSEFGPSTTPGIEKHFDDHKVNKDDIPYIKDQIKALSPAELDDFVKAARHEMLGKISGNQAKEQYGQ